MVGDLERFHELVMNVITDVVNGERTKQGAADDIYQMVKTIKNHTFAAKYRR